MKMMMNLKMQALHILSLKLSMCLFLGVNAYAAIVPELLKHLLLSSANKLFQLPASFTILQELITNSLLLL